MVERVAAVSGNQRLRESLLPKAAGAGQDGGFQELLKAIQAGLSHPAQRPVAAYLVRRGDTLSHICQDALKRQGLSPSLPDISNAVRTVARANKIANPDRIFVGQTIDLSSLSVAAGGKSAPSGNAAAAAGLVVGLEPAAWASQDLTKLIHSLLPSTDSGKQVPTSNQNPWKGILETPAELSSGFGVRQDPITGQQSYHPGIDLAANPGTNIYSFKSGVVTFSGSQPAYGKIVVVRHEDGTETAYAHNARNLVQTGDRVTEHTQIAQVGATGRVTGPHLHFELRRDGVAVDPTPLFEKPSFQIAKAL